MYNQAFYMGKSTPIMWPILVPHLNEVEEGQHTLLQKKCKMDSFVSLRVCPSSLQLGYLDLLFDLVYQLQDGGT